MILSFSSFCVSVIGLHNFESSYCVLDSPICSNKKFFLTFCFVFRNSSIIKFLFPDQQFLGMTIAKYIFEDDFEHDFEHDYEHEFRHDFEHDLNTISNAISNMISSCNSIFIITKQFRVSLPFLSALLRLTLDFSTKSSFLCVNMSNYNNICH